MSPGYSDATREKKQNTTHSSFKRWSYFIRKVYETDPLVCSKCQGEMRIISFIDQPAVIRKILQQLGLWEVARAPPDGEGIIKALTFDPSYTHLT